MGSDDDLRAIGWTDAWQQRWDSGTTGELVPARVARTDRGVITVWLPGSGEVRATTTTAAKDVVAGDWVGIGRDAARVERIVERASAFERRAARGSKRGQVLAANMDVVMLVEAAQRPALNQRRLERGLVLAHQSDARPLVVVTKCDLVDDAAAVVAEAAAVAPGVEVVGVSARSGSGLDALRAALRAALGSAVTVAALGASGVGKSTLVNALAGSDVQVTGRVRHGDAKGRHTTTAAQLVDLGGLIYIDTPGVRALGLWGDGEGLDETFAEIAEVALRCRFDDCTHDHEPDCAVRDAVDVGELRDDRVEHYRRLRAELLALDDR